jgi:hypothetical protein
MSNPSTPRPARRWRRARERTPNDPTPTRPTDPTPPRRRWTVEDVQELGATTDLVTAAAILGIGRSTAYALARAGDFPAAVIRAGARYLVPVPALLALLHGTSPDPATHPAEDDSAGLDPRRGARVHGRTARPADYTNTGQRADTEGDSDQ